MKTELDLNKSILFPLIFGQFNINNIFIHTRKIIKTHI